MQEFDSPRHDFLMENGNNYSWRSRHHNNNNRNHHHDTTPSATDCDDESDDTKVSDGRYFQPSDKFQSNGSVSKAERCNATASLAEAVTLMSLSSSSDNEDGEKCEKDMKLGDISEDEDEEEDLEEEEQDDIETGRTQSKSAEIMFMMLAHSDRVKQKISSDTSVITKNTQGLSSVPDQSKASRSLEHIRARYGRPKTEDKSSASPPRASELHRNVDDDYDDGDNEEKQFLILNDKKAPKTDVTRNEELTKSSRSKSNLPSVSLTETTRDKTARPSSVIADIRNARSGINRKTENSSASPADSRRPIFYFDEDKNLVISSNGPINVSISVHRMAETANSSCEQDDSTRVLPIGGGSSDTTMQYEENNDDDDDDDCDPEGHVIREYWRLAQNPPEYSEIQKYQPDLVDDERVSLPEILSSRTQSRQRSPSSYPDTTENNSMASATANSQEIRMPFYDALMSTARHLFSDDDRTIKEEELLKSIDFMQREMLTQRVPIDNYCPDSSKKKTVTFSTRQCFPECGQRRVFFKTPSYEDIDESRRSCSSSRTGCSPAGRDERTKDVLEHQEGWPGTRRSSCKQEPQLRTVTGTVMAKLGGEIGYSFSDNEPVSNVDFNKSEESAKRFEFTYGTDGSRRKDIGEWSVEMSTISDDDSDDTKTCGRYFHNDEKIAVKTMEPDTRDDATNFLANPINESESRSKKKSKVQKFMGFFKNKATKKKT